MSVTGDNRNTNKNTNKNENLNCAPFTDYISKINNKEIDNAIVTPMYILIEYSNYY